MRRLIIAVAALALLAGCSTGGNVTRNDGDAVPVVRSEPQVQKPEPKQTPTKAGLQAKKVWPESRSTRNVSLARTKEEIDEEDDIRLLMEPDMVTKFDIPIVFNDAVQYYIRWFSTEKRKVFGNWLKRSRKYVPMMRTVLREEGLPEDLVYLAMIESGFNPKAYSTAKASGPWQFISETGERYGLKVNYWVDERRDPEKSTVAATKYLKKLFNQFGCWYLAAAGYNAGERRIERAIEQQNTSDIWELMKFNTLPRETKEYIPRLIAAAIIAKDPEKFGFDAIDYDQPANFQFVTVPGGIRMNTVAQAASADPSTVKLLNPEILRGITPPNVESYSIKLPMPLVADFKERLGALALEQPPVRHTVTYKGRKGDTLATVLKRYGIDYDEFCLVNDCGTKAVVKRGSVVLIPQFSGSRDVIARPADEKPLIQAAKKKELLLNAGCKPAENVRVTEGQKKRKAGGVEKPVVAEPSKTKAEKQPTYHVVKQGESITSIADKYNIDAEVLKSANRIKGDKIFPNMKLRLASQVRKKETTSVKYHVVKKGETLVTIAKRYGVEVDDLKGTNQIKGNTVKPKTKLKIVVTEG